MVELRENLTFGLKASQDIVGIEAALDDFDCDLLLKLLVRARCQVDHAESAAPDLLGDPISAELSASEVVFRQQISRDRRDWLLDEPVALRIRPEHGFNLAAQHFILATLALEESVTFPRRKFCRCLEQPTDLRVTFSRL
jgi:hypothetical protein